MNLSVPHLVLPDVLPHPEAIRSWGQNAHTYEPEFWELEYCAYRYLKRISDADLGARYRSILRNMRALVSPDRYVIPLNSFLSSWYWYRKEHQTRLEAFLRKAELAEPPPSGSLDNPQPNAPIRPRSPNAGDVIFRYGGERFLRPDLETGFIRISPAAEYARYERDEARQDDELAKHEFMPGEYTRVTTQDGQAIPVIGDIRRTVRTSNYYVLCASCDWDDQLFSEFRADACFVITKPEEFARRLERAAMPILPGWYFYHNPLEYFDPFESLPKSYRDAAVCKDFKFAYQREYRFVWSPLKRQQTRGFTELRLGPLTDIASLSRVVPRRCSTTSACS